MTVSSYLTLQVKQRRLTIQASVCEKHKLKKIVWMYPKVSGLITWSENCKWYSSLPPGAVVSLFCEPF
jgi:hypothetical protein